MAASRPATSASTRVRKTCSAGQHWVPLATVGLGLPDAGQGDAD